MRTIDAAPSAPTTIRARRSRPAAGPDRDPVGVDGDRLDALALDDLDAALADLGDEIGVEVGPADDVDRAAEGDLAGELAAPDLGVRRRHVVDPELEVERRQGLVGVAGQPAAARLVAGQRVALEHQDVADAVLVQARGDRGAGRAGAHDDHVMRAHAACLPRPTLAPTWTSA